MDFEKTLFADMKTRRHSSWYLGLVVGLLLFFALALAQITTTSPTFDEGFTLFRGYAALRTGYLVPIKHPPLAHWLSALGVTLEPNLPDPRELRGWQTDQYDAASRDLLWERGLNAGRIVFLGRYPILLLGVILGAATARWAGEFFGWGGAAAALALHALSPNLIAHSAVATTDLAVTAFYFFALYAWFRFAKNPGLSSAALAGVCLGLALAAKFSALLLLPTLGLLALLRLWQLRNSRAAAIRFVSLGSAILLSAFLALWGVYRFAFDPFPLAQYLRELNDLTALASEGHTAYLFGLLSVKGWWVYHPLVFLVKTPLPLLLLSAYGVWRMARAIAITKRISALAVYVFVPAAIYFAAAAFTSLNVGYRYLLPVLPLAHIIAASAASQLPPSSQSPVARLIVLRSTFTVSALLLWHAASTFAVAPHFLAYFNELVGPANGYEVLADSNLDWGQDLPSLARYLNGRAVNLSYFGQADPHYYGINSTPLPGWPPPPKTDFAPADPAPGLYAISASNLVGVQLEDPNTFAYFRTLTPIKVINYSIFVYEIAQHDPITSFAQCAPPILKETQIERLLNRNVRTIYFDCVASFIQPAAPTLLLYPADQTPLIDLGAPVFDWKRSDGTTYYRLYHSHTPTLPYSPIANGQYLTLLSYELTADSLTLHWLVTEPAPPPVSIFVHFNWPDGALAEAYDALGVPAEYWQKGDVIVQRHFISPDLPRGEYGVTVGLYSLADGARYSDIALDTYKK